MRKYVRAIEEVMIRTVADFGVAATRFPQWPGVWVAESRRGGPRKIAALGVHLSRWYTKHGFALNVNTTLSHFELIVPCGIREAGVTSLEAETGAKLNQAEVEARIAVHFGAVFECEMAEATEPPRTVCVVVTRSDGRVLLLKRTPARGGFWQPVTGHVEAGEPVSDAARRELYEETGLRVESTSLGYEHVFALGETKPPQLLRESAFTARGDEPVKLDSTEHEACAWFTAAEAMEKLPFAGLRRAVQLAVKSARIP